MVGYFSKEPTDLALPVTEAQFIATFGSADPTARPTELQARRFFEHGGGSLIVVRVTDGKPLLDHASNLSGLHAAKIFGLQLLLIPEVTRLPESQLREALTELKSFADDENLFVILDPPDGWNTAEQAVNWVQDYIPAITDGMAIY
ncbi:MAG: hypothetical protein ACI8XO_003751 [Verrucomicrobiales bacterium]